MSVFQYAAEAYRLLLMLVGLILEALFGPLRYLTLSVLLIGIPGGIWLILLWHRRRTQAGKTRER
jgi:hypothetical protein